MSGLDVTMHESKAQSRVVRPHFAPTVDEFPLHLPIGKELEHVLSVSRALGGDIYVLNAPKPDSTSPQESRLPFINRFDATGNYLNGWGPETAPVIDGVSQWPRGIENVEADSADNVWVTGYAAQDNAILRYSKDGEFIRQYGRHGPNGGDDSTTHFNQPPSVYHDVESGELFIADGYGGHRVIAVDAETGEFTRMWGAYGMPPTSMTPETGGFSDRVHKVARGPDGLIYVCDRAHNRIQAFELIPGGVKFVREVVIGPMSGWPGTTADLAFSSDGKYMFVSDMTACRLWSVDRETFEVLGWSNGTPETEGDGNIGLTSSFFHRMSILPGNHMLVARNRRGLQIMRYLGAW